MACFMFSVLDCFVVVNVSRGVFLIQYSVGECCNLFSSQVAVPEVVEAVEESDILIFVVPHQFIPKICEQLTGHVKAGAIGISLIKVRNGIFLGKVC